MSKKAGPTKTEWTGRVLTFLAVLPFFFSVYGKLSGGQQVIQMMGHLGWPVEVLVPLAILEATCVLLYLIPQVSVLGAIILTGYLGGAIATHVRLGETVYVHAIIGIFIWGGLYLREPRLRALIPIRRSAH